MTSTAELAQRPESLASPSLRYNFYRIICLLHLQTTNSLRFVLKFLTWELFSQWGCVGSNQGILHRRPKNWSMRSTWHCSECSWSSIHSQMIVAMNGEHDPADANSIVTNPFSLSMQFCHQCFSMKLPSTHNECKTWKSTATTSLSMQKQSSQCSWLMPQRQSKFQIYDFRN